MIREALSKIGASVSLLELRILNPPLRYRAGGIWRSLCTIDIVVHIVYSVYVIDTQLRFVEAT